MLNRKEFIEENDWVIAVEPNSKTIRLVQAQNRGSFSAKEGDFLNKDMIGKRYGAKMESMRRTGYMYLLHPMPYLWPSCVDYRTQILYQPDISLVQYFLDLKPGSVIIESGTGSGVLTTSLARAVAPHGHVHTFEFHPERCRKAYQDFENNKLLDVVTVRQRDIVQKGFPFFPQGVDAAFLDLPSPDVVLDSVDRSLRPQGRICNFSPCIEQVQRVCLKLADLGYEEIFTVEILSREYELCKSTKSQPAPFNQAIVQGGIVGVDGAFPLLTGNEYTVGLHSFYTQKENERKQGIQNKKQQKKAAKKATAADAAASTTTDTTTTTTEQNNATADDDAITHENKKQKTEDGENNDNSMNDTADDELCKLDEPEKITASATKPLPKQQSPEILTTRPLPIMRGHTGYLTFARKPTKHIVEGQVYATPLNQTMLKMAEDTAVEGEKKTE